MFLDRRGLWIAIKSLTVSLLSEADRDSEGNEVPRSQVNWP